MKKITMLSIVSAGIFSLAAYAEPGKHSENAGAELVAKVVRVEKGVEKTLDERSLGHLKFVEATSYGLNLFAEDPSRTKDPKTMGVLIISSPSHAKDVEDAVRKQIDDTSSRITVVQRTPTSVPDTAGSIISRDEIIIQVPNKSDVTYYLNKTSPPDGGPKK